MWNSVTFSNLFSHHITQSKTFWNLTIFRFPAEREILKGAAYIWANCKNLAQLQVSFSLQNRGSWRFTNSRQLPNFSLRVWSMQHSVIYGTLWNIIIPITLNTALKLGKNPAMFEYISVLPPMYSCKCGDHCSTVQCTAL